MIRLFLSGCILLNELRQTTIFYTAIVLADNGPVLVVCSNRTSSPSYLGAGAAVRGADAHWEQGGHKIKNSLQPFSRFTESSLSWQEF